MCEYAEFCNVTHPRSRRDRKCYDCRGIIAKGEQYVRITGKWEGDFSSTAYCLMCNSLHAYCVKEGLYPESGSDEDCGVIFPGHLHEAVRDFPEIPIELIPPALLRFRE